MFSYTERFPHSFWPVSQLSALSCLAGLFFLIHLARTTPECFYLAGVAALLLLCHLLAWMVLLPKGKITQALWSIIFFQTLIATLMPLFFKDYLTAAPFLLLLVPFEVLVVDHLRNVPLALTFVMLAASLMLTLDLLALATPGTVLGNLIPAWFLPLVLSCHALALVFLARIYRFRLKAPMSARFNIVSQQALLTMIITATTLALVSFVLIKRMRQIQVSQVGQSYQRLAELIGERTGNILEEHIQALQALGNQKVIQEGLLQAMASQHQGQDFALSQLQFQEQQWSAAEPDGALMRSLRNNEMMLALATFRKDELSHNNLFLTDRMGALLAIQGRKPLHYSFRDQPWWQKVWNDGLGGAWLGNLQIHQTTATAQIFMAVSIRNPKTHQTIGILASDFQLRAIQTNLAGSSNKQGEVVQLIDGEGNIIAEANGSHQLVGQRLWDVPLASKSVGTAPSTWILSRDFRQLESVIGHAPLTTSSRVNVEPISALGWRIMAVQEQEAALTGVVQSTKIAALVGLLAMVLGLMAAVTMARIVGRPVKDLTQAAVQITDGDLDHRATPAGPEEMVTLAHAFNTLTSRLRAVIQDLRQSNRTLEDKVLERTEKLRRTQKSLIDGAHYSGMAEIVTGILHNIGNLLNSINVSVQTTSQVIQQSRIPRLQQVNQMLATHHHDLAEFLTKEAKGPLLISYLLDLTSVIQKDNNLLKEEVETIQQHVDLIRQSLVSQQKYARSMDYMETVQINELVTDIVMAEKEVLERLHIQIQLQLEEVPPVKAIRTKLSYVFLSLLENAWEAMENQPERRLQIKTYQKNRRVHLLVCDSGVGIEEQHFNEIFQYGFSTKTDRNGFGLHTCANTMKEMKGEVLATSEGTGKGACFSLSLPVAEAEDPD